MDKSIDINSVRSTLEHYQFALRNEYGVAALALFGSTVRGEAGPASDLDMLVEFNRPVGYMGLVALAGLPRKHSWQRG